MNEQRRRLKDKVWKVCDIKIRRVVAQYKSDNMTENETLCYLVDVEYPGGRKTLFNSKTRNGIFKQLKEEYSII